MNKLHKLFLSLFVIFLILPNLAFASWWNPFSWNIFSWFNKSVKTENINVSTSTKIASSTIATSTYNIDAIIKAKVEAQIKTILDSKINTAVKAALEKQRAEDAAMNLSAQNAANLIIQQQINENIVNQIPTSSNTVKPKLSFPPPMTPP